LPCSSASIFIPDPCPPSPSEFKVGSEIDVEIGIGIGFVVAVPSAAKIAGPARVEFIVIVDIVVVAGTSGPEVPSPSESGSSGSSVFDVVTGGTAVVEEDWTGDLAIEETNAEVLEVELKVESKVDVEDEAEEEAACCKIRVRASSRLVRCTVVAKHHEHNQAAPEKKTGKTRGER
jgi:hypothetical protein